MQNPMDNLSQKEIEENLGLNEGQKSQLEAIGLKRDEIRKLHMERVAEGIQREREKLDRLERKITNGNLGAAIGELLDDETETTAQNDPVPTEDASPIFSNDEANRIIGMEAQKTEGFREADEEFMDALMDLSAEDYDSDNGRLCKAATKCALIISPIAEKVLARRWKGYDIAFRKWEEDGHKGIPPESWTDTYLLPIFSCYDYLAGMRESNE